jgi:hypothetical protein
MWQQRFGGAGVGGGEGVHNKGIYRGKFSRSFFMLLRKVGWLGINFSSVSEFHVVGNENRGNLFTSSILGWGI